MLAETFGSSNLTAHPEGGHFREYYRSSLAVSTNHGDRPAATAIYFLLKEHEVSHLHKVGHDEIWCWHDGGNITLYLLSNDGMLLTHTLGKPDTGGTFAYVVPANTWFGATTHGADTLVSAIVAPGFEYADFVLGEQDELLTLFPDHTELIRSLTR